MSAGVEEKNEAIYGGAGAERIAAFTTDFYTLKRRKEGRKEGRKGQKEGGEKPAASIHGMAAAPPPPPSQKEENKNKEKKE
jgi:hypothetical protein